MAEPACSSLARRLYIASRCCSLDHTSDNFVPLHPLLLETYPAADLSHHPSSAITANENMLHVRTKRPAISLQTWVACSCRAGPSRIQHSLPAHRTFYSDLYENEGHLFDLHRDEGRPTVQASGFNSRTQQQSRFSTSRPSAYEVERQMQRVSKFAPSGTRLGL